MPAMKHMPKTALGQADHATAIRKAIKAHADTNMHTAGRRDDMEKNRYLPYMSRACFWGSNEHYIPTRAIEQIT